MSEGKCKEIKLKLEKHKWQVTNYYQNFKMGSVQVHIYGVFCKDRLVP